MSTLFVLVCGFLLFHLVEPSKVKAIVKRNIADTEKLSKEVGGRIREALTAVRDSSNKSETVRISYILQQVDQDISQHKLISKIATVNNAVLRVQLVAINLGYDLLTPPGEPEIQKEDRVVAVALLKMYMDLAMVEISDRIMANASFIASENLLQNRTSKDVLDDLRNETEKRSTQRKLMDEWFQVIVAIVDNEPKIKSEFDMRKDEAKLEFSNTPLVKLDHSTGTELKAMVLESSLFRQATLNKQFLKLAFNHNNKAEFLFARAVYQLARKPNTRIRINEVFQQSLSEIAKRKSNDDTYAILRERLFITVAKLIAEDEDLNAEMNRTVYALDVRFTYEKMRDTFAPF